MQILKTASLTSKIWLQKSEENDLSKKAVQLFDIDSNIADILIKRGVSLEEIPSFLEPKLKNQMKDPFCIKDMEKACSRIHQALVDQETIVILGDYDVDGITSTTVLFKYLKNLEANLHPYIPNRYLEGYGISLKAVDNIKKLSPKLLILLDNGSLSVEEIEYAKSFSMEVIIVDHHSTDTILPKATAIINPKRFDDSSREDNLCTAGLVFLLLVALNSYLSKNNYFNETRIKEDIFKYLDLIALGTVCDMVPLVGLNRALVFQGIKIMHKRENKALRYLSDNLGITKPLDVESLGFSLGPCINAGSRMGESRIPLDLFLTEDEVIAHNLSLKLISLNQQRQIEEDKIIQATVLEIEKISLKEPFIFVGSKDFATGIVGIIAGRIKENYGKVSLVYGIDEATGICTGSGRSIAGINLGDIIIGAKQKGLLIKGGGHSQAVGFSFSLEKKEELFNFINKKIGNILDLKKDKQQEIIIDKVLPIYAINIELAKNISYIQPFGISFPEPIFMLSNVQIINLKQIGSNKNHLMLDISDGLKFKIKAFCYKCIPSKLGEEIINKEFQFLDIAFVIKYNLYQGKEYANIVVIDIADLSKKY